MLSQEPKPLFGAAVADGPAPVVDLGVDVVEAARGSRETVGDPVASSCVTIYRL
jgi:hypothetical protein